MTAFRALVVVETVAEMAAPRPNSTNLIMHAAPRKAARMRMEAGRATSGQACGRRRLGGGSWSPGRIGKQHSTTWNCKRIRGDCARSAHEALPQTPPGGKPPETPGPFPSDLIVGAPWSGSLVVSRPWIGPEEWVQTREGEILLDKNRPSHGRRRDLLQFVVFLASFRSSKLT